MAIIMGKLYSALLASNVSEDQAMAAAEEVAAYNIIMANVRSAQRLHTRLLIINTVMMIVVIGKLFLGGLPPADPTLAATDIPTISGDTAELLLADAINTPPLTREEIDHLLEVLKQRLASR